LKLTAVALVRLVISKLPSISATELKFSKSQREQSWLEEASRGGFAWLSTAHPRVGKVCQEVYHGLTSPVVKCGFEALEVSFGGQPMVHR
jgi:hypothetical protein